MKTNRIFIGGVLKLTILFIMIGATQVSCKREHHEEEVTATITWIEPGISDTLSLGEELHAEGTIVGSADLHGYELKFIDVQTQTTLYSGNATSHASSYAFHEHWVNNVIDTTNVKVEITVTLDHDGNTKSESRQVVLLP